MGIHVWVRRAVASALLCLAVDFVVSAQPAFKYSKVEFAADLPAAYETADEMHEGDLFFYFYRAGDPRHAKMDSLVFSDRRLSGYISENFGALAADVGTEVGRRVFEIVNPGVTYEYPFIVVVNKGYSNTMFFTGWENVSPWLDDYGLDSNGQHWLALISAKEFGVLPSRPGEEDWGRWSARVRELLANHGGGH